MKRKELRLCQGILLLAALCLCATACEIGFRGNWPVVWVDESHPGPRHHAYYYYPEAEVYFDPSVSLYYWHENNDWRSDRRPPHHVVLRHKERVRFESDADRPYVVHERVVKRFHSHDKGNRPGPHEDRRR